MIELANPDDAKHFTQGARWWSADGRDWVELTHGAPWPESQSKAGMYVIAIDHNKGVVTYCRRK